MKGLELLDFWVAEFRLCGIGFYCNEAPRSIFDSETPGAECRAGAGERRSGGELEEVIRALLGG